MEYPEFPKFDVGDTVQVISSGEIGVIQRCIVNHMNVIVSIKCLAVIIIIVLVSLNKYIVVN